MTSDEIQALEELRCAALLRADVAMLDRLLAGDFAWIHSSARVDDRSAFLQAVGSGAAKYLRIAASESAIRIFGDGALVSGRYDMDVSSGGAARSTCNRTTMLWVRQPDGAIRLAWGQSTALAAPEIRSPGDKVTS